MNTYENYYQISPLIRNIILSEKPEKILEISAYNLRYGNLFAFCQRRIGLQVNVDRVLVENEITLPDNNPYNRVIPFEVLLNAEGLERYDVIFIANLFEFIPLSDAFVLLDILQTKINKQIIILTPETASLQDEDGNQLTLRTYHPTAFLAYDFTFTTHKTCEGTWQIYSIYRQTDLPPMTIDFDKVTQGNTINKLDIAYVLPHLGLTGGMKALFCHIRELTKRGHRVTACIKSDTLVKVLPAWSNLSDKDVFRQIVVPTTGDLVNALGEVDVIIVGWMTCLDWIRETKTPVVLWEQGSEYIYGDMRSNESHSSHVLKEMRRLYRRPVHILAASNTIVETLKARYNRMAELLPVGIDTDFYYPGQKTGGDVTILLVGNPNLQFKGFDFAINLLIMAYELGLRFRVNWACQCMPNLSEKIPFEMKTHVSVSQEELSALYREADIFISTSLYESFPLPPLEAMASGTAVLATDCGGINTYAKPGENCLLCDQGDIISMLAALEFLVNNPSARQMLAKAGRKTAESLTHVNMVDMLEAYLNKVVAKGSKP